MRSTRMLGDAHSDILAKLADVSALRAKIHAANIANQNTPGYKAQGVAFEASFRAALDGPGNDPLEVEPTVFELADGSSQPDGNNVAVDREVLEQAQNSTLYNAYMGMLQGRKKLLTIAMTSAPGG